VGRIQAEGTLHSHIFRLKIIECISHSHIFRLKIIECISHSHIFRLKIIECTCISTARIGPVLQEWICNIAAGIAAGMGTRQVSEGLNFFLGHLVEIGFGFAFAELGIG
jgi:hypothetical protein